jgi:cysteine-rich repeat protein
LESNLGEACDDGNTEAGDECQPICELPSCGDGFLDAALGEACDDGNNSDDDGCLANCAANVCGDGILNPAAEACDDGNNVDDDGCDADCSLPDVVQVALGRDHTCALFDAGNIRCWGDTSSGELGYGNPNDIGDDETPAEAGDVPLVGKFVEISSFDSHTCALSDTGAVSCWGLGANAALGYGNRNDIGDDEPALSAGAVNVGGPVAQLAVGGSHTCALLVSGAVRCWGENLSGQLGYGNTEDIGDDELPFAAGDVNVGGTVIQLTAGFSHTCALLDTGNVRCWGRAALGQLGYGNTQDIGDDETPAEAGDVNIGGSVVQLDGGSQHTCALLDTGSVRCWGGDGSVGLLTFGQLGYGNTETIGDDETPADAGDVNIGGQATSVAAGFSHSCALLDTGNIRCWGKNFASQLGYADPDLVGDDELPFTLGDVAVGARVQSLSLGEEHSCAVLETGALRCWGAGALGQLGYGNTNIIGNDETPAQAGDVPLF